MTEPQTKGIIFQAGDPDYQPFFDITSPAADKYAKKLKCDYKLFLKNKKDFSRHMSWYKTFILKELLEKYDWILLLDGDALVLDTNRDITTFLSRHHHLHVCADGAGKEIYNFNAGIMLLKSTTITRHLIKNTINTPHKKFYHERNWEQSAMHAEVIKRFFLYKDKIKIHGQNLFNHNSEWIYHPAHKDFKDKDKLKKLKLKA